jgi:hypothetical protein
MNNTIQPLFPEIFTKSEIMILDFNQIPSGLPEYKNIKIFFENCYKKGIDPKLPENRQNFNNNFLEKTNKRYLIGRYLEDRIEMLRGSEIETEGRTIHQGIDVFSKDLELVSAPCDVEVIKIGREKGEHGFGYYMILKPDLMITKNYIFIGHLSKDLPKLGKYSSGQELARMGDYENNENGGWSRHIHVQLLSNLPINNDIPWGYSAKQNLDQAMMEYPDPSFLLKMIF